jgi:hypothetical protein
MATNLNRPPAPDWWEQQTFFLTRREGELRAEERWLQEEQTLHFPARCQQRDRDYAQQEAELVRQSQARLRQAFFGNTLWLLRRSVIRPVLTRSSESVNLDREIAALRRTFHQLHERDSQYLARRASDLRLNRARLETDKQTLRALAATFGASVNI